MVCASEEANESVLSRPALSGEGTPKMEGTVDLGSPFLFFVNLLVGDEESVLT